MTETADQRAARGLAMAAELAGPERQAALERFEWEHARLQEALGRFVEREDANGAVRKLRALCDRWWATGRVPEGRGWGDAGRQPVWYDAHLMASGAAAMVAEQYQETHRRVLRLVEDLSEAQVATAADRAAHSIGWNLWHLARWADHLSVRLAGMTPELGRRLADRREIWESEELAARWGLDAASLGADQTGMLMDEALAAGLPLPPKDVLVDYARRAFAAAEAAIAAIDDAELLRDRTDEPGTAVGRAILVHIVHDNRHLGEIECLRGLLGLKGTATR